MVGGRRVAHDWSMTMHARIPENANARRDGRDTNGGPVYPAGAALMTAAGLDELRRELEQLRQRTQHQVEQRLREARPYGEGSNNDEYHAVREEQMVLEARVAALEDTIDRAVLVDAKNAARGAAVIGATVTIEDLETGTRSRHLLRSAHHPVAPDVISAASPMGQALMGARAGTVVTFELPNGRSRSVRLVAVRTPPKATGGA
jgi:transcription elongation factor GreA